jgi:hypothetical protein
MTNIQYAIARCYAQTGASWLKPDVERYRQAPQIQMVDGGVDQQPDNLDLAAAVRRISGDSRRVSRAARSRGLTVERLMLQKALRRCEEVDRG